MEVDLMKCEGARARQGKNRGAQWKHHPAYCLHMTILVTVRTAYRSDVLPNNACTSTIYQLQFIPSLPELKKCIDKPRQ